MQRAGQHGIGPLVYFTTQFGYCTQFIDGVHLSCDQLKLLPIAELVTKKIAQLNCINRSKFSIFILYLAVFEWVVIFFQLEVNVLVYNKIL